jgi:hypothetical protein
MHHHRSFRADDLQIVSRATHEEVLPGDFVRLASGGPQGLVRAVEGEMAHVVWLTLPPQHSSLPWVCLRPSAQR